MHKIFKILAIALTFLTISGISVVQAGNRNQQLAESLLNDIGQSTWIAEGKGPHVVYIFFDPNCPYCHKLYERSRPWVTANKLELRWIPVGILMTTSHGKAVAMLGADDPLQAFYQNEEHYDRSSGGGVDEDLATPAIEAKLKVNENLLARTGFGAVPLMLYRNDKEEPILIQGAPTREKLDKLFAQVK